MVTHLPDRSRVETTRPSDPGRADRYRRALCESDLPALSRLVGLVLSVLADETAVAERSLSELARDASIDRRTITRSALPPLITKSWLQVDTPPEVRRGARNRYTLLIPSEAATVTVIDPKRVPVTVRRLAVRLDCTQEEAAAVVDAIRAESGGRIANIGGLLRRMDDDELAEYLADVRDTPPPAQESKPEWCSDHDMPGGTLPSGQLKCAMCRART